LKENVKRIYKIQQEKIKQFKYIKEEDRRKYESAIKSATTCHICQEELGEDRVIDHCHLTGKFRGAAHTKCNRNYKIPNFILVFLHNLSGYDSHLFIKKLKTNNGGDIICIPKTEENYISFNKKIIVNTYLDGDGKEKLVKREIRFLDSYKFMSASLDNLSKNLTADQFKNLSNMYSGERFNLLQSKGHFRMNTSFQLTD